MIKKDQNKAVLTWFKNVHSNNIFVGQEICTANFNICPVHPKVDGLKALELIFLPPIQRQKHGL